MASIIRPDLDYSSKDFDALRSRMFNLIASAFPEWTDTQVANFGNVLVELVAWVGDVLGFYQDNQGKESRWSAAKLRRNLLGLIKLIGYIPPGATAATADLTFLLSAPPVGDVNILAGDQFRTLEITEPVVFQALAAATIPAGTDPPVATIQVEHSSNSEEVVQSSELPNQVIQLADAPYIDGSLTVVAGNGTYTIEDDFLESTAIDLHATITVDENDRVRVIFGNGISGAVPTGAITFGYKTGGGSSGNVEQSTIRRAVKAYVDTLGNPVQVTVTNPARATGGFERQTVEGIRFAAPRSVRAPSRTVAREDYEINAERVPQVARALMLSRDDKPSILENQGELYVVPHGGGVASTPILEAVRDMVTLAEKYPKTITFRLTILSAAYFTVDVVCRLHLVAGSVAGVVDPAVRAAIAAFFAIEDAEGAPNELINFGYYMDEALAWSDVFNTIRDVRGVRKIDDGLGNLTLNNEARDLAVPVHTFPVLGAVTLINAATGAVLL